MKRKAIECDRLKGYTCSTYEVEKYIKYGRQIKMSKEVKQALELFIESIKCEVEDKKKNENN